MHLQTFNIAMLMEGAEKMKDEKYTLEDHIQAIQEYAKENNCKVIEIYCDANADEEE